MRVSAFALVVLCVVQTSCACKRQHARVTEDPAGPGRVEFIGLFEERAEVMPGLRSARTIHDLKRLLNKADEPGGTTIQARFVVQEVLADGGRRLKPGHRVCIIFRTPTSPNAPSPLPAHLVGKRVRIVLHDPFQFRYYGRFSYSE